MQHQPKLTLYSSLCLILLVLQSVFSGLNAQNYSADNKWLSDQISELEKLKDRSSSRIINYKSEIQKCENTIKKSEDIIDLAKQKNNRQAETVATDALMKSYAAKKKNLELLDFENFQLNLIETKLSQFRMLLLELEYVQTGSKDKCDKWVVQLERDKRALKNFMKTIRMSEKEGESWTEEGKDAMKEAGVSLLKFFTGEIANHLTKRDGKIKLIKKQIDKYKNEKTSDVIKNKYLLEQMDKKLKKAEELFIKISVKKTADYTLRTDNMIDIIKSEAEFSQSLMESGDKEVMEILKNREIQLKLSEIGSSFADLLLEYESEIRASTQFFKTLNPLISRLPLIRDLSYAGTKLYLSSERVEQLSEVADQELKAVNSLKKQIELTNERLNDCRKNGK